MKSIHAIIFISLIWLGLGGFYYPKWKKGWTEAAISWDVSGYYHYLPGIFIYKDIRQQAWMNAINEKYLPSAANDQAFGHVNSGNKVNKYAIGQAVMYAPFFFTAHAYASWTGSYPADGYSRPYQIAIWLGSLLVSILGLIWLRRILLHYTAEKIAAFTLLGLGLATHWIEYASISNGMNHTWLFALLCGLILSTIRFYKKKDWTSAIGIGAILGLAILTRPTEIIWALIPLLWGVTILRSRVAFLLSQWPKIVVSGLVAGGIIFIQLGYWKYSSGEWVVYSYGDQGFNWLNPKIWRGLMGTNIGWWTYTPLMLIAMIGWRAMFNKHRPYFWATSLVTLLSIYLTLAWGHFEGGGGLGQRNLIQIYPLMAFPLMMVITSLCSSKIGSWVWYVLLLANIYYSGWWVHQAHRGGYFQAGQMTTPYFYRVVGRLNPDRDLFKLLDTKEYFTGTPESITLLLKNDFETDTTGCTADWPGGGKAKCLDPGSQFLGPIDVPVDAVCGTWLRFEADFYVQTHEWDIWKQAQWIVQFHQGDTAIKTNFIRVQRIIAADQTISAVFFDVKIPSEAFDRCTMTFWNANSTQTLMIDNLKISCFSEK